MSHASDDMLEGLRILIDCASRNDKRNFEKFKDALMNALFDCKLEDLTKEYDPNALDNLRRMNRHPYYNEDFK